MKRLLILMAALAVAATVASPALAAQPASSCALSAVTYPNGAEVIQVDATGLHRSADFRLDWTEPQITQTEFSFSTSQGNLTDTVMNDQGPGTYSVSLFYLKGNDNSVPGVFETGCSLTI